MRGLFVGLHGDVAGAQRVLRFLNCPKASGRQKREDGGPQAGHVAFRYQDRLSHQIRVHLIKDSIPLGDATLVYDAANRDAVFFNPLQDHARMESSSFDGGEQLVLRGVSEPPAKRDAAQFRIYQHRAIPVVPSEAQQSGCAGVIFF